MGRARTRWIGALRRSTAPHRGRPDDRSALHRRAHERSAGGLLDELGYAVRVRHGDGHAGWPEHAPFDAVLVTAAPPEIPQPLLDQLAVGGRLVAPVGEGVQELVVVTRTDAGYERRRVTSVRFVPMTGRARGDDAP